MYHMKVSVTFGLRCCRVFSSLPLKCFYRCQTQHRHHITANPEISRLNAYLLVNSHDWRGNVFSSPWRLSQRELLLGQKILFGFKIEFLYWCIYVFDHPLESVHQFMPYTSPFLSLAVWLCTAEPFCTLGLLFLYILMYFFKGKYGCNLSSCQSWQRLTFWNGFPSGSSPPLPAS